MSRQTWLVSLTDLICVLLAFFVLKFAMARPFADSWHAVLAALGGEHAGHEAVLAPTQSFTDAESLVSSGYLLNLLKHQLGLAGDTQVRVWRQGRGVFLAISFDHLFSPGHRRPDGPARPVVEGLGQMLRRLGNQIEVVGILPAQPTALEDPMNGLPGVFDRCLEVADVIKRASGRSAIPVSVQLAPSKPDAPDDGAAMPANPAALTPTLLISVWEWGLDPSAAQVVGQKE